MKYLHVLIILANFALALDAKSQIINTIPSWNGTTYEYPLGNPNTQSYGVILDAPNATLNNFSFELKMPSSLQFQGYVGTWNGTGVSQILYASPITTTPDNNTQFDQITFNTGSLDIGTGSPLALFVSVDSYSLGSTATQTQAPFVGSGNVETGELGLLNYGGGNTISSPSGEFVYLNSSDLTGATTGKNIGFAVAGWALTGDNAAYSAQFSDTAPTPEPSTWAMLLGGLGLLAFWRTRRTRL